MMDLPAWAKREENYRPDRDRDAFISRSLLRLLGVLQVLRAQAARGHHGHAPFCLFLLVLLILFIATARTSAFLWLVLGGELVLLCFLPGDVLRKNLLGALTAGLLSLVLILPALLIWGGGPYLLLPFKTVLCVIALNLLQEYFSWHEITGALRTFRLPSEAVFILDTTLRYLVLLGDQAGALLTALKLRSVGHNRRKHQAMAGIMGILMQRSQRMSVEMVEAMRCRGFTGEYTALAKNGQSSWRGLFVPLVLVLFYTCFYLRLEGFPW
ncbi:energy-coupling factor transporter transmembrane protein EcfT [Mitsuokella sp. AF33-22]|uniref:energy-coupling factor transporter transmembrane component T family protein n=1 Tax=Mitsuokella sp. AF33-22 TaxID=2292047 RepID=UPI0018F5836D|nr:energy-coupling factor transporter transmembrane component T [Mitsuokella sp. AF33-22]